MILVTDRSKYRVRLYSVHDHAYPIKSSEDAGIRSRTIILAEFWFDVVPVLSKIFASLYSNIEKVCCSCNKLCNIKTEHSHNFGQILYCENRSRQVFEIEELFAILPD